jgi:thioredoxin-like negative regulator of GroEL
VTCQQHQINAMPTFVLFVRRREVERLQGANPDRLRQLIDLHFQAAPKPNNNAANQAEREWLHKNLVSRVDSVSAYSNIKVYLRFR